MIITIFGKPRSGKSTLLASVSRKNYIKRLKYLKRIHKSKLYKKINNIKNDNIRAFLLKLLFPKNHYDVVYSTDPTIHYTTPITYADLGKFKPQPNSLFLLEEGGIGLDSRKFKDLTTFSKRFAAMHGHLHVDVLIVSQTVDIDKAYRQRSELMYIAKKIGPFTVLRKILYSVDVDETTHDLVDAYTKIGVFGFLWELIICTKKKRWAKLPFGTSRIIFRPAWYNYFNSYVDDFDYPMEDPYLTLLKKQAALEAAQRREQERNIDNE